MDNVHQRGTHFSCLNLKKLTANTSTLLITDKQGWSTANARYTCRTLGLTDNPRSGAQNRPHKPTLTNKQTDATNCIYLPSFAVDNEWVMLPFFKHRQTDRQTNGCKHLSALLWSNCLIHGMQSKVSVCLSVIGVRPLSTSYQGSICFNRICLRWKKGIHYWVS